MRWLGIVLLLGACGPQVAELGSFARADLPPTDAEPVQQPACEPTLIPFSPSAGGIWQMRETSGQIAVTYVRKGASPGGEDSQNLVLVDPTTESWSDTQLSGPRGIFAPSFAFLEDNRSIVFFHNHSWTGQYRIYTSTSVGVPVERNLASLVSTPEERQSYHPFATVAEQGRTNWDATVVYRSFNEISVASVREGTSGFSVVEHTTLDPGPSLNVNLLTEAKRRGEHFWVLGRANANAILTPVDLADVASSTTVNVGRAPASFAFADNAVWIASAEDSGVSIAAWDLELSAPVDNPLRVELPELTIQDLRFETMLDGRPILAVQTLRDGTPTVGVYTFNNGLPVELSSVQTSTSGRSIGLAVANGEPWVAWVNPSDQLMVERICP